MAKAKKKTAKTVNKAKNKTKKKASKTTGRGGISRSTYDKLFVSYEKHTNISKAAKHAGVTNSTARRYIMEGRPEHGMPCIADRIHAIRAATQDKQDIDLSTLRSEQLEVVRDALGTSKLELQIHKVATGTKAKDIQAAQQVAQQTGDNAPLKEAVKDNSPARPFELQVRAHTDLVHLAERCLGAADKTIEIKQDPLEQMTDDELQVFLSTGEYPDRFRKQ